MRTIRFVILALAISVLPHSQLFASSCEERCDGAQERCETHTSAITGAIADTGKCITLQLRCTQEENAKLSRGGFPDIARCTQLGNDCSNQAGQNAGQSYTDINEQCEAKHDACINRCDR